MTWSFDHDVMEEFENEIGDSEDGDESVDERCNVEGTPMTEHFKIDTPDTSNHGNFDDRTFSEIGTQTETTLSVNSADIIWTPHMQHHYCRAGSRGHAELS